MQDRLSMKVGESRQHLVRQTFQVCLGEEELRLVEHSSEVVLHIVKDHIDRACRQEEAFVSQDQVIADIP